MLSDSERSMLLEQLAKQPHRLAESFTHEGHARTASCRYETRSMGASPASASAAAMLTVQPCPSQLTC